MTTERIAVTLPRKLLRKARNAVRQGEARSLSAYISKALEQKTMLDELDAQLGSLLLESGGPLTAAEIRKAAAALVGPRSVHRRR